MHNAKADAEKIVHDMLPFARKMLEEFGEFIPFGAAMTQNGDVKSVAARDNREHPPSQDVIDLLRSSFRSSASSKMYKATGIFYDVRIPPRELDDKTDAIAVELDHEDNYSVVVYVPYILKAGNVEFGRWFASPGADRIFPRSLKH